MSETAPTPSAPLVVDFDDPRARDMLADTPYGAILIGTSSAPLDSRTADLTEQTTFTIAPGGTGRAWVSDDLPSVLADVAATFDRAPVAAATLTRLLLVSSDLPVGAALELESAVYSMLLVSVEIRRWRSTPQAIVPADAGAVRLERRGNDLEITLDRPRRRNALVHQMRDQLVAAAIDPSIERVHLPGAGPCFCNGGDLDEFGTATDPAEAHLIRLTQNPGALIYALRQKVRPTLHGACIGAGVQIPSFVQHIVARPDAWFRPLEVEMGLIPGAGGTVSLPRRIGRRRTACMALTGRAVDARTALDWGLVDAVD